MFKHTQTIRWQIAATDYLSVFAHFVGLVLERLMKISQWLINLSLLINHNHYILGDDFLSNITFELLLGKRLQFICNSYTDPNNSRARFWSLVVRRVICPSTDVLPLRLLNLITTFWFVSATVCYLARRFCTEIIESQK